MRNNSEENSQYFFIDKCNEFKMQNNMSSTSLKDDSIKNFENNNFYFNQNSEKDALFPNAFVENMENRVNIPSVVSNKKNCKKMFTILKIKKPENSGDNVNSSSNPDSSFISESDIDSKFEKELDSQQQNSDNRICANSKVNFSKLTEAEKDERLKNLAKLVKRLRRKTRNLEQRFKKNTNKILNRYMSNYLGIKKYKSANNLNNSSPLNFNIDNLCKSLKMLRSCDKFDYDDQRHVIENLIKLIAEEKIQLDSINFRKICTQIRLFLSKEQSNYISKKGQKITFSFPEKDINISTKEYELYSKYKDKEEVIRTIIGIPEESNQSIYPDRINFETKKEVFNFNDLNSNFINNTHINKFSSNNQNGNSISTSDYLNGLTACPNGNSNNNSYNHINANVNANNSNYSNISSLQDQLKKFPINKFNLNDVMNLGMISNNGNLKNLLLNSIYSNLIQNISSTNNAC